jgi:uncharacterized protein (DUF934 family)
MNSSSLQTGSVIRSEEEMVIRLAEFQEKQPRRKEGMIAMQIDPREIMVELALYYR